MHLFKLKLYCKIKNPALHFHQSYFKYWLPAWAHDCSIRQHTSIIAGSSVGQRWSRKGAPGTVRPSTCCCYCFTCQTCQCRLERSFTLVKEWVSRGLGISVEQVRSWWKQLVTTCVSRLAHEQRRCTFSQTHHCCLRGPGGKHFSEPGEALLLICSP